MKIDPDKFYEAIAEGTHRAFWQLMTNATSMPCNDFYATIERAAEAAFKKLADEGNK